MLGFSHLQADPPREHKKRVGKAVHVGNDLITYGLFSRQGNDATFGTTAYSSGQMKMGTNRTTAGQHKGLEWLEILIEMINKLLQRTDIMAMNQGLAGPLIFSQGGQIAAQVEKMILGGMEPGADLFFNI
jgi:hypothetical protein